MGREALIVGVSTGCVGVFGVLLSKPPAYMPKGSTCCQECLEWLTYCNNQQPMVSPLS